MIIQFTQSVDPRIEHLLVRFSEVGYLPLTRLSPTTFTVEKLEFQRQREVLVPSAFVRPMDQVSPLPPASGAVNRTTLRATLQISHRCNRKPVSWFRAKEIAVEPVHTLAVDVELTLVHVTSQFIWTGLIAIATLTERGASASLCTPSDPQQVRWTSGLSGRRSPSVAPTKLLARIEALRLAHKKRQVQEDLQAEELPDPSMTRWPFRPISLGANGAIGKQALNNRGASHE